MALLAYFGCLRACEVVAVGLDDLEVVRDGVMTRITRSKTTSSASRFLLPASLSTVSFSPSQIFLEYVNKVKPFLLERKFNRLWPRPISTGFSGQFRGKCYMGQIAKKIATFLKLDPAPFTGHSFRRSSATSAADSGISMINLKRLGGWKSDSVASSYVDRSLATVREAADHLAPLCGSSDSSRPHASFKKVKIDLMASGTPPVMIKPGNEPIDTIDPPVTSNSATSHGGVIFNFYINK
jgi:integrase